MLALVRWAALTAALMQRNKGMARAAEPESNDAVHARAEEIRLQEAREMLADANATAAQGKQFFRRRRGTGADYGRGRFYGNPYYYLSTLYGYQDTYYGGYGYGYAPTRRLRRPTETQNVIVINTTPDEPTTPPPSYGGAPVDAAAAPAPVNTTRTAAPVRVQVGVPRTRTLGIAT